MNGSRRVRASSVLPRSVPPCLFKGHLSTKSNAFCTDSSSLRLSTLHMVKNHMAVHYNKILSAKAVVDCSAPLSISACIKYADQQRREKLKKELAQCERELKVTKITMQANSKNISKALFNTLQKPAGQPRNEDNVLAEVNEYSSFARSPGTSSERLHLSLPKSSDSRMDGAEKNFGSFLSSINCTPSRPRKTHSATSYSQRPKSTNSLRSHLVIKKTFSGDLLDKHSELFSNGHLPFTPRTLKTEAKSFLSQYRYYTPAKRKKDFTGQRVEAETQTELSSFESDFETVETKDFTESEVAIKQAPGCMTYGTKENLTPSPSQEKGLPWNEVKDGTLQCSPARALCQYSEQPPPSRRKIYSDEEELLYLSFIEDITDEILKLGLFSNSSLERLFERHIRQNKRHLEERKMRHLLHILKVNLGCVPKESSVKQDDFDLLNLLDFEKAENSTQNEQGATIQQEHQECRQALIMLQTEPKDENEIFSPNDFFLPIYKFKNSEEVIIEQVNEETNLRPSSRDEKNPNIFDSSGDQETSVTVIEGDSDTEKTETPSELDRSRLALSPSVQLCTVMGGSDRDLEEATLQIMALRIEDSPGDV
ncbi:spermatogenesis-associated protein 7 isoform X2 [Pipistrellus kuhlii]|uniref:Spermatogenesis associated 7 n=2 Tax=Pipistrellus kuhlii TaxID=59472 RepID=A0A7J8B5W3_PIPKU|nr:spermatogenesis-associated protein 7 isoform X2 [Pipistrellus kuhlii]KAF6393855.1 spermatogenesis associated 7 [Pipistrellus kuhlii]